MFIKLCFRIFSFSVYPVVFKNPDSCSVHVPVHVPADVGCNKFSKHDVIFFTCEREGEWRFNGSCNNVALLSYLIIAAN